MTGGRPHSLCVIQLAELKLRVLLRVRSDTDVLSSSDLWRLLLYVNERLEVNFHSGIAVSLAFVNCVSLWSLIIIYAMLECSKLQVPNNLLR